MADRPTARDRALKRGADQLMDLASWALRDRPRALRRARERYVELCLYLYGAIGRGAAREIIKNVGGAV